MPEKDNDTQKRIADKEQKDVFDKIHQQLITLNQSQAKVGDSIKKQQTQDLKEKTQEPDEPQKELQKVLVDDDEKQMSALRKTFEKSFGSIKESFSPGGLLKGFGLLTGSPIFMLLGDKFDDLIGQYSEFRKENKEAAVLQQEANQESFEQEDISDKEFELAEKQNELLEDIRDKEFGVEDKKGGLAGIIGGIVGKISGLFSTILPKSLGKIFSKGLFGAAGKGLGKAGGLAAAGAIGFVVGTLINKGITKALGGKTLGSVLFDWVNKEKPEDKELRERRQRERSGGLAGLSGLKTVKGAETRLESLEQERDVLKTRTDRLSDLGEDVEDADIERLNALNELIETQKKNVEQINEINIIAKAEGLSYNEALKVWQDRAKAVDTAIPGSQDFNETSDGETAKGFSTIKKRSSSLDNIDTTIIEQKKASAIKESRRQQIARDKQTSNNLIHSTQNNIVMQEDLSTKIDDKNLVTDSWF
jgi:hypothetical protein